MLKQIKNNRSIYQLIKFVLFQQLQSNIYNYLIGKMQKNRSFIDLLRNDENPLSLQCSIHTQNQRFSTKDSQDINKYERRKKQEISESIEFIAQPTQFFENKIRNPQSKNAQEKVCQVLNSINMSIDDQNNNFPRIYGQISQNTGYNNRRNNRVKTVSTFQSKQSSNSPRNDQIIFQIKLKLASFLSKFKSDSTYLTSFRQNSIQQILQQVFKKLKQYTKQHDQSVKRHNQLMKYKEIQILNLQGKISSLQEHICQETNKWTKKLEKLKEQNMELQSSLQIQVEDNEKLQQKLYMVQSIVKEQNQYIKNMQKNKKKQIQQQISVLENGLIFTQDKLQRKQKQHHTLQIIHQNLQTENEKIKYQLSNLIQSNKQYQHQYEALNQKLKGCTQQLEVNQQKLIVYYDAYQKEVERNNAFINIMRDIQSKCQHYLQQQQQLKKKIQQLFKSKQHLQLQKQAYKKQVIEFQTQYKALNQHKQAEISKITQDLKNQNQQKIKSIIDQWHLKLQSTVEYYQKYIEQLEQELHKRKQIISKYSIQII